MFEPQQQETALFFLVGIICDYAWYKRIWFNTVYCKPLMEFYFIENK